jgi:hypothetical protein
MVPLARCHEAGKLLAELVELDAPAGDRKRMMEEAT